VALGMAMPVLTPLGLPPALILTTAAVFGLTGVSTVGVGSVLTMVFALALGAQSLGAFAQTGLSLRQDSLFSPARAADTKAALLTLLQSPNDRFGPLITQLDANETGKQMLNLVARLAGGASETWMPAV